MGCHKTGWGDIGSTLYIHGWVSSCYEKFLYKAVWYYRQACSHIAALLSCIINANEIRNWSGVDSCTSNLYAWNHPVQEVFTVIGKTSTDCVCLKAKPVYLVDKFHGHGSCKTSFGDYVNGQPCKIICRHASPSSPANSSSHLNMLNYPGAFVIHHPVSQHLSHHHRVSQHHPVCQQRHLVSQHFSQHHSVSQHHPVSQRHLLKSTFQSRSSS